MQCNMAMQCNAMRWSFIILQPKTKMGKKLLLQGVDKCQKSDHLWQHEVELHYSCYQRFILAIIITFKIASFCIRMCELGCHFCIIKHTSTMGLGFDRFNAFLKPLLNEFNFSCDAPLLGMWVNKQTHLQTKQNKQTKSSWRALNTSF